MNLSDFETAINFLLILGVIFLVINILFGIAFIFKKRIPRKIKAIKGIRYSPLVLIIFNIAAIAIAGSTIQYNFTKSPEVIAKFPNTGDVWSDYSKPLTVTFDRPVKFNEMEKTLTPDVIGEWKVENIGGIIKFPRKVVFYPKESFPADNPMVLYFTKVRNLMADKNGFDHEDKFKTPLTPNIIDTDPKDQTNEVATTTPITLKLDNPSGPHTTWGIKVTPEIPFKLEDGEQNTKIIKFDKALAQSTEYVVEIGEGTAVYNIETKEIISQTELKPVKSIRFKTVPNPTIAASSPSGDVVLTNEKISVTFNDEMVIDTVEKNFTVTPNVDGTFAWTNPKTLVFSPKAPLEKNTNYVVTLKPGTKSKIGGIIESEVKFDFTTVGFVKVKGFYPNNGSSGLSINTKVTVDFNQDIDRTSAQSKFVISPSTTGSFGWDGTVMIFTPSSLGFNTKYNISIQPGVKSINGLDSNETFNYSFTTQPEQYMLNVPLYLQGGKYDCNLTAARMALAYRGVYVSQDNIVNSIGYASPRDRSGNTWGNPNAGFVGYRDGPGYGVHWGPISNYISAFRGNSIKTGWSMQGIAQEIQKGNPVIIWWHNGLSGNKPDSWNTPSGQVYTYIGMHSEVVVGFNGSADNPSSFILNDPWRGRRTMSAGNFDALWANTFGRTAIVVN